MRRRLLVVHILNPPNLLRNGLAVPLYGGDQLVLFFLKPLRLLGVAAQLFQHVPVLPHGVRKLFLDLVQSSQDGFGLLYVLNVSALAMLVRRPPACSPVVLQDVLGERLDVLHHPPLLVVVNEVDDLLRARVFRRLLLVEVVQEALELERLQVEVVHTGRARRHGKAVDIHRHQAHVHVVQTRNGVRRPSRVHLRPIVLFLRLPRWWRRPLSSCRAPCRATACSARVWTGRSAIGTGLASKGRGGDRCVGSLDLGHPAPSPVSYGSGRVSIYRGE
mmetsp:Transcript_11453/g.20985  ORF Transcript_11453/g.20985 Transcript_11453/m.20985 type:complete len:275 (-) Transcript_11453:93-917(-)